MFRAYRRWKRENRDAYNATWIGVTIVAVIVVLLLALMK